MPSVKPLIKSGIFVIKNRITVDTTKIIVHTFWDFVNVLNNGFKTMKVPIAEMNTTNSNILIIISNITCLQISYQKYSINKLYKGVRYVDE